MTEPIADVATAVAIGSRHRQEDAVIADFADGADSGFAVLSDGMGGHDDGDLASRIIVSEVFGAFSVASRAGRADPEAVRERLRQAVLRANRSLRAQVDAGSGQKGMGGTVITTFVQDDTLRWVSVGDSGLYLFRSRQLWRLNEIHSLAPQIDMMARQGVMNEDDARNHPQRGCLTSALVGAEIERIDCPAEPVRLMPGDVVLMASDGLEVLDDSEIRDVLCRSHTGSSQEIARALMDAVALQEAPDQDNVSIVVIKPNLAAEPCRTANASRLGELRPWARLQDGIGTLRDRVAAPRKGRSAP